MTEGLYLRPSSLARLEACPASYWLGQGITLPENKDAAMGTRIHEFMAGNAVNLSAEEADMVEVLTDALATLYETEPDIVELEIKAHIMLPSAKLEGTADRIEIRGDRMTVIDYKTGRTPVPPAAINFQLHAYGLLALSRHRQVQEVELVILQPYAPRGGSRAVFTRQEMAQTYHRLVALVGAINAAALRGTPHKGDHCTYCPALATCPAHRETIGELATVDSHPGRWEAATVEEKLALWDKIKQAKKAIALIESLYRRDLESNGEYFGGKIFLGAGRTQREVTDPGGLLRELSRECQLDPAEFAAACKVKLTDLEGIVKKRQSRKGKEFAAWYTAILDRYSDKTTTRGALETK